MSNPPKLCVVRGTARTDGRRAGALPQAMRSCRLSVMRVLIVGWCLLLVAAAASAQCPGDCNGDGVVRIDEMVQGVRIALGDASLDVCPLFDASGDGAGRIEELVAPANSALSGCPATPSPRATETPSPSPSASATLTETATPAATPTIPAVAGKWREEPLSIGDSTCLPIFNEFLAAQFEGRGACDQDVVSTAETTVRVTDCSDQAVDGTLDRDGTIHLVFPPATSIQDECELTLNVQSAVPAATSPTTASYIFDLTFGGVCDELDDCRVNASGSWTRLEP